MEMEWPSNSEEVNDSPIEQVRLTVPIMDDPTQPCLTFRTWVLGITSCVILAFLNQFFGYRTNGLSVSSVSAQIVVLPIGRLMAAYLPAKPIRIPKTKWSFSLNPSPFNLKEHVLITIFASSGASGVYAVNIITIVKAFYRRRIHIVAAMLLTQTTQAADAMFREFGNPWTVPWTADTVLRSFFKTYTLVVHKTYPIAKVVTKARRELSLNLEVHLCGNFEEFCGSRFQHSTWRRVRQLNYIYLDNIIENLIRLKLDTYIPIPEKEISW